MESVDSAFPEFEADVLAGKRRTDRWLAPLCGGAAFLFYLLLIPHATPSGPPAELAAAALGVPAQTPAFHLLWRLLAAVASLLPAGSMSFRLALLCALANAVAASLVYQAAVELMMHRLIPNGTRVDALKVRAIHAGGAVAAVAFATTIPMALASTRASLRTLDILPLIGGVYVFLRYLHGGRAITLLCSAVLFGLGMGEDYGCVLFFAVATVWGIVELWRQDRSTLPMLAFAALALVLALLAYPAVTYFGHIPGGGMYTLLKAHWADLQADYGVHTGMFLGALALFPLILTLSTLSQTLNYGEEYESLLIDAVLASGALLVLANLLPPFQAYLLASPEPAVLPYFLAAMTAGFAAAAWWAVAFTPQAPPAAADDEPDLPPEIASPVVKGLGYSVAIAFTAVILGSAVWTAVQLRARPDGYAQRCAEQMLDELGPRRWVFGNTPANTPLAVLARERGLALRILPLTADWTWTPVRQRAIREALAQDEAFAGQDRGRLAGALALGPDAFLRLWLLTDPQAVDKLVIAGPPRLWATCGYCAVPETFFFSGTRTTCHPPSPAFTDRLRQAAEARHRAFAGHQVDRSSLVPLQITDLDLSATAAYAASMLRRNGDTNGVAALAAVWNAGETVPPAQWRLFAASLSWIWETTLPAGRPEQRDVLHVVRQEETLAAQEMDGDLLSTTARRGQTIAGIRQARRASTMADMYALARDNVGLGRVDEAFLWLGQLDQGGASEDCLRPLRAEASMAATGTVDLAIAMLRETTAAYPRDLWSWHLLAAAYLQHGDTNRVAAEVLPAMTRASAADNDMVRLTLALLTAVRTGPPRQREARDLLVSIAEANPDLVITREWALRFDMLLGDDAAVRRDAGVLLGASENHPQANYALAVLAMHSMQLAEAERLFSRSLAGALTPQAIVGRARLCVQRRLFADALQLARKATTEYPTYGDAWNVLADALEKTGKGPEAEVIRSRAVELNALQP